MYKSKSDLSAGHVKIDYLALQKTAEIAMVYSLQAVEKHLREFYGVAQNYSPRDRFYASKYLAQAAQDLAEASEMNYVIFEGRIRAKKELVNVPKIPENGK